jgi:hypothetical protein
MILYGYQCRECGQEYTSETRGDVLMEDCAPGEMAPHEVPCQACGHSPVKRKYSLAVHRPMHEHFNQSVGKPISSDRQFRDELKRKSDEHFLRTGIPADYQPVDPEVARAAVEKSQGMGLESTNRRRVNEGKRAIRV